MATEQGVSLQQDTLTPVSGGPVRTILATVPINGVPTQVQMQVVAIADERGVPFAQEASLLDVLEDILAVLKDIRTMQSFITGLAVTDQTTTPVPSGIVM